MRVRFNCWWSGRPGRDVIAISRGSRPHFLLTLQTPYAISGGLIRQKMPVLSRYVLGLSQDRLQVSAERRIKSMCAVKGLKTGAGGRLIRRVAGLVLLMLGAMLGGGAWDGSVAQAMHEINHRLTIYGTVKDAQGKPVADARVIISATRMNEGTTAFTDRQGHYESTLHVHDTDLGEPIDVSTGDETQRIAAQFNPQDTTTERRMEVNFGPAPAAAAASSASQKGPADRSVWLGAGALLAAVVAGSTVWYVQRQRSARSKKGQFSKRKHKG